MATEEAAVLAVHEASEKVVAPVVVLVAHEETVLSAVAASVEAGNREVSEQSLVSVTAASGVAAVEVAAMAGEEVVHMAEMVLMEAIGWEMVVALIALVVALAVALEEALEVVLEGALKGDRVKQEGVDTAAEVDHSVDVEG